MLVMLKATLRNLENWCVDILSSFLPLLSSFVFPCSSFPSFSRFYNIWYLSIDFAPLKRPCVISPLTHFMPAPLCSDKDLLSQTRTLAMSFVKCASTDTEHQYKLVKDISFWDTCRHTVAYGWINKWTHLKGTFLGIFCTIFRLFLWPQSRNGLVWCFS